MAKSKRWSMKDITVIKKFIKEATDAGHDEHTGIVNAAAHFGVTPNAVKIRYGRYLRNEDMGGLKKNTTKVPIVRKTRKYTKKQVVDVIIDDGGISRVKRKHTKRKGAATLVDNIKRQAQEEVQDFSQKQSMTRELRKMVIDLMNTSGHIRGVSVDLSSKSFTVIF